MNRLASAADALIFEPQSARTLGILRAITCSWLLLGITIDPAYQFGLVPETLWQPTSVFRPLALIGLGPLSVATLKVLTWLWVGSLVAGAAGLFSRVSVPVAAVLGLVVLGYMNNFGKIHHAYNLPMFALIVLTLAPCGDGFSIDAWRHGQEPKEPSSVYGWAVFSLRFCFCLLMCFGGLSKLFGRWLPPSPEMFEFLFGRCMALAELKAVPLSGLSLWLANHGSIAMLLGFAALLFEISAPVALFRSGWTRVVIVLGLLGMQLFNALALGIHLNVPWLVGYAAFVDWDRLGVAPRPAARAA